MIVNSETLPSRLPTRPALSTGGGGCFDAWDASSWRTFSSAVLPTSGAPANSLRICSSFSSTDATSSVCVAATSLVMALPISLIDFEYSFQDGGPSP